MWEGTEKRNGREKEGEGFIWIFMVKHPEAVIHLSCLEDLSQILFPGKDSSQDTVIHFKINQALERKITGYIF